MKTYACGFDYGNSLTKLVWYQEDRERKPYLHLPSATLRGNPEKLSRAYQGLGKGDKVKDMLTGENHIIGYKGLNYYIGELALKQGVTVDAMTNGVAFRYWDTPALLMLLTISGLAIKEDEYDVLAVTGLPVISYLDDNKNRVKGLYNGKHYFTLDGKERIASIKVGKILAEAAGAIIVGGLEDQAKTYGVIDVGSYTTDIYTLEGLYPIADRCTSYEVGVSTVAEEVIELFEQKYGFPLSQAQQNNLLYIYQQGDYTALGLPSKEQVTDIMAWTTGALTNLAEKIKTKAGEYWRTGSKGYIAANFSRVEIVGGGAYLLTEFLQKFIPNLKMQDKPVYANVRGYAWLANEYLKAREKA